MAQQMERTRPITSGKQWARRSRGRRDGRGSLLALAATLLLASIAGAPVPPAAAQTATECAIPDAREAATPAASTPTAEPVIIAPVRRGVSTPVVEIVPAATPVATPDPLAPLRQELTDVSNALAVCLSAGEAELVSTLATERYLGQLYGSDAPLARDDYLALAAELDPIPTEIRDVTNIALEGDDRATAEVTSVVGRQLLVSRWSCMRAPESARDEGKSRWQVDREAPLPFEPPGDAQTIAVTIADFAFGLDESAVAGPNVVLSGGNSGSQDHEMLVLRLAEGTTTQDLLRGTGPGLPENITYIGQATVPVAQQVDLVLIDLQPGTYTIVCFFLTPEGIPHLALGMEASFTVEE